MLNVSYAICNVQCTKRTDRDNVRKRVHGPSRIKLIQPMAGRESVYSYIVGFRALVLRLVGCSIVMNTCVQRPTG